MNDEEWQILEARTALEQTTNALCAMQGKVPRFRFTDRLHLVPEPPLCSLCNKGKNQVGSMITIKTDSICDECIVLLYENIDGTDKT
jgi:ClpX C4-type zinc finger